MCKSVNILVFRSYQCCPGALSCFVYFQDHLLHLKIMPGFLSPINKHMFTFCVRDIYLILMNIHAQLNTGALAFPFLYLSFGWSC